MMEQIKPEVIGWKQLEFNGKPWSDAGFRTMSKDDLIFTSIDDLNISSIKSKFRPVYKKDIK